jgi:hypothetical protein
MQDVLSLILGGGQGSRLYPLTKHRAKPAISILMRQNLLDPVLHLGLQSLVIEQIRQRNDAIQPIRPALPAFGTFYVPLPLRGQ